MTEVTKQEDIAEAKRQALASDVAELKDRFRANDLINSVASFFGMDTNQFKDSTRASESTLPYAMIGAGAAMLASRVWQRRDEIFHSEDDVVIATDLGSAHRRLRQRQDETPDAYAARTYAEYGLRLEIDRYENEDDDSFMDRIDAAMNGLSDRLRHGYRRTGSAVSSAGGTVRDGAYATGSTVSSAASSTKSGISSAASGAKQGISSAASATKSGVQSAASGTKSAAGSARDSVVSAASATKRNVQERAHALREHARSLSDHASEQAAKAKARGREKMAELKTAHEDNPSVGVGLGMGLGLVLGSLFPTTEREKKATDPLADALMSAASSALSQMNEKMDQAEQDSSKPVRH